MRLTNMQREQEQKNIIDLQNRFFKRFDEHDGFISRVVNTTYDGNHDVDASWSLEIGKNDISVNVLHGLNYVGDK
jgi:hypothetical protein